MKSTNSNKGEYFVGCIVKYLSKLFFGNIFTDPSSKSVSFHKETIFFGENYEYVIALSIPNYTYLKKKNCTVYDVKVSRILYYN